MKHNIQDRLLTPGASHGRNGRKMIPKGIVIHYVGNPGSTAEGNRNYFESGSGGNFVSAHYVISLQGEILRCVPDNECAAHAGRAYGAKWRAMAPYNNSKYIGIECCHPDAEGKFSGETASALIDLCAELCNKHKLNPETDILRHYDVSGKCCPKYYVENPAAWAALKEDIFRAYKGESIQEPPKKYNNPPVYNSPAYTPPVYTPPVYTPPVHTPSSPAADEGIPILAPPSVTIAQMRTWARNKGAAEFWVSLADDYYDVCRGLGIDPAVAYAQSALETGYGNFPGSILDASWHNLCGLKTAKGGGNNDPSAHQEFPSWDEGLRAHIDHLALYAGVSGYPKADTPDPRHFPEIFGKAKTVTGLAGTWATDAQYAVKLDKMISSMRAVKADNKRPVPIQTLPPIEAPAEEIPSDWARDAWKWAREHGYCDGARPHEAATREEVVTILRRIYL
ncbi:MAG: N-acetylmuramoyl-L-alanine amidase [Clostridiales bacterium]|jgi:N-acetyl-anhydromuramyl-L-alanine amidase AmpD|nr:N-acetylmuramoyl-L-alanine amidase [Clostridiales bacterium]